MENSNILCEFCKKVLTNSNILKHIASSHFCKLHYGQRYIDMKKKKANEKKQKWRKVNKEKELKRQRELYAECLEKKRKKEEKL